MENKLVPGPIQTKWLQSLREHPERQMKSQLGKKNKDGSYTACCLGEYCLIAGKGEWRGIDLIDKGSEGALPEYNELGLIDRIGTIINFTEMNGRQYGSLAGMNDGGITWPEIAEFVESHFDKVFTKSL